MVTLDVKQILIALLLIALIVMVVYIIVILKNLVPTIKKLSLVVDDAKRITVVAANKTEQIDGALDNAGSKVLGLTGSLKGGSGIAGKASAVGAGVAAAKSAVSGLKGTSDKEYLKRAKERKAAKSKSTI